MLRNVTESQKKRVAGRQRFKCAASVPEYTCPLKGEPFDESGYEIDHIKELRDGGTNDLANLQALCVSCHRVKTSRMTTAMPKRDIPKIEVHMCYHCEKYTATVFEHDKWHCETDCIKPCNGICKGGCGSRSSPNQLIPIRKQWTTPSGKVMHTIEFPR
jgi:hypothetical protein